MGGGAFGFVEETDGGSGDGGFGLLFLGFFLSFPALGLDLAEAGAIIFAHAEEASFLQAQVFELTFGISYRSRFR